MSVLLPSSEQAISSKGRNVWHQLGQPKPFIENLITGNINDQISADAMAAMVSGIPTPWARAKLFQSSFGYAKNPNNGLGQFCKQIVGEWKGLLALLAIHPNRVTFKQVTLNPNDTQSHSLELKNAMGRMLFDERDLWTDPELLANSDPNALPYVQLIYYRDKLVGFVSPYTLVCTAAEYDHPELQHDISWFRNGKLNDPMPYLGSNRDNVLKIFILLNNIRIKLDDFIAAINKNRSNNVPVFYNDLISTLDDWRASCQIAQNNVQGTLDEELHFNKPYYSLFNISQEIFYDFSDGKFSKSQLHGENTLRFDIRKLFLDSAYLAEFEDTDKEQPLSKSSVYYLVTKEPSGRKRYFALPLSHLGIIIFQNKLADILNTTTEHTLTAEIRDNKLLVRLSLFVDNEKQPPIDKEFAIEQQIGTTPKSIIWPNFYSVHWTRYYFYSELPRNAQGMKFYPFYRKVAKNNMQNIQIDELETNENKSGLVFTGYQNLIKYPVGQVDNTNHKYELLLSKKPIAGIEIRVDKNGQELVCGTLTIKKGQNALIQDLTNTHAPIQGNCAKIGIDFGSNNTCISYEFDGRIEPINFNNRRIFLTGTEVIDPHNEYFAQSHELLFYQNESPKNGQIKSWINKPDERYKQENVTNHEFVAGNPVFEPNIDVRILEEYNIRTNNGHSIAHNLKWKNDPLGITTKEGFMKTLFMKICAELYHNENVRPDEILIKWAYPSALSRSDQRNYANLYAQTIANCPIDGVVVNVADPITESQAVCNYAIGAGAAPNTQRMMIGIDVGGSTSDILLVSHVRNEISLIQQSSVRLSAGKMASVIENSSTFSQSILSFAQTESINITGIVNINQNRRNAPYYLNALFDRLDEHQFPNLYRRIFQNSLVADRAKSVFAIPAFITGALMYYAGQLARYAIDTQQLNDISDFVLYPFGKGGRIFDWLSARLGTREANSYYEQCLKAGLNTDIANYKFDFPQNSRKNIKSEVSMGLLRNNVISHNPKNKIDIVGEEGFCFNEKLLKEYDEINKEHFGNFGAIRFPFEFVRFNEFLKIYIELVGTNNGNFLTNAKKSIQDRMPEIRDMLFTYIQNDPQYNIARGSEDFSYSQPIFILTAISFLENVIIPLVQKETVITQAAV